MGENDIVIRGSLLPYFAIPRLGTERTNVYDAFDDEPGVLVETPIQTHSSAVFVTKYPERHSQRETSAGTSSGPEMASGRWVSRSSSSWIASISSGWW